MVYIRFFFFRIAFNFWKVVRSRSSWWKKHTRVAGCTDIRPQSHILFLFFLGRNCNSSSSRRNHQQSISVSLSCFSGSSTSILFFLSILQGGVWGLIENPFYNRNPLPTTLKGWENNIELSFSWYQVSLWAEIYGPFQCWNGDPNGPYISVQSYRFCACRGYSSS